LVPLRTQLQSGDRVEVLTRPSGGPSRDWLQFVVTGHARRAIRLWFARREREEMAAAGREALTKALRADDLPAAQVLAGAELDALVASYRLDRPAELFRLVGEGHLAPRDVVARVKALRAGEDPTPAPAPRRTRSRRAARAAHDADVPATVHVDGQHGIEIRMG